LLGTFPLANANVGQALPDEKLACEARPGADEITLTRERYALEYAGKLIVGTA
jgi:hypothetical protein